MEVVSVRLRPLNTVCDEWKDFSGNYFVGDDGYLYRRLESCWCRSEKYNYQQVRCQFGTDKKHTVKMHRAVALAFLDNPEKLTDVDHVNNDKTDNRAVNLQWMSHKDNILKIAIDRRNIACG